MLHKFGHPKYPIIETSLTFKWRTHHSILHDIHVTALQQLQVVQVTAAKKMQDINVSAIKLLHES